MHPKKIQISCMDLVILCMWEIYFQHNHHCWSRTCNGIHYIAHFILLRLHFSQNRSHLTSSSLSQVFVSNAFLFFRTMVSLLSDLHIWTLKNQTNIQGIVYIWASIQNARLFSFKIIFHFIIYLNRKKL